jgi:hypothetical protein
MTIPFLCVGTGRLLILASVSDARLFSVGRARLTFRRYFHLVQLRAFDQFGSRVVSGEVGGGRKFERVDRGIPPCEQSAPNVIQEEECKRSLQDLRAWPVASAKRGRGEASS